LTKEQAINSFAGRKAVTLATADHCPYGVHHNMMGPICFKVGCLTPTQSSQARFAGHVVDGAVDAADFVDDAGTRAKKVRPDLN